MSCPYLSNDNTLPCNVVLSRDVFKYIKQLEDHIRDECNRALKTQGDAIRDVINDMPAVDAVPVVRCRDCVSHGKCITEQFFEFCGKHDGFCCVGKRLSNQPQVGN